VNARNVLIWHVHGSWTTSLVAGSDRYLLPVVPDRGPDGRGRARTWDWPDSAVEVTPEQLREQDVDVVVLQRPHEAELVEAWTGRRAGVDLPALYVEHNTPRGDVAQWRHPLADTKEIPLVHVTAFNAAMWDNGIAPVRVIEHGIADPGYRYTGQDQSLAVCVNEPVRRWRVTGMDLAASVAAAAPLHVYGMGLTDLPARFDQHGVPRERLAGLHEDLPQADLHDVLGTHRAYLHPYRWTSLGLALIEAMTLGMPCLALAATAAPAAVPPGTGVVSADVAELRRAAARLMASPDEARELGLAAREHALTRFGLRRFLADWEHLLTEVTP
jgi:glycosyltransferase involved in cell wall biosynthesis